MTAVKVQNDGKKELLIEWQAEPMSSNCWENQSGISEEMTNQAQYEGNLRLEEYDILMTSRSINPSPSLILWHIQDTETFDSSKKINILALPW